MKYKNITLLYLFLIGTIILSNPKVALVLSGGSAKGYAHIPVLEMIDSLNIDVDLIVGTSIGANVGALYSAGYTSEQIYEHAFNTNWKAIFLEKSERKDMSYFHKKNHSRYQIKFNLNGFKPKIPTGAIHGQRAYMELSKILGQYEYINNFDSLTIPFKCNATDLISGEDILLEGGSLIMAVRSSVSIPSVFAPVDYDEYLLVDGGVKNNIPVNLAKKYNPDIIITSTVASKPTKKQIKSSVVGVLEESIFIHSSDLTKSNLENSDYVISTKIPDGTSAIFTKKSMNSIYRAGKKAVYDNIDIFLDIQKKYKSDMPKKSLKTLDELNLKVKNINIYGNKKFDKNFIQNGLGIYRSDTLKLNKIHNGINNLYGLGYFNKIKYKITPNENLTYSDIDIILEESSFNKLQTGLKWDNFHELIAAINIRTNDLLFPGLLINNEFQFPGIRKNSLEISYPGRISIFHLYPFLKNEYLSKKVNWYNANGEKTAIYNYKTIKNKVGAGVIIGKNCGIEVALQNERAYLNPEIENSDVIDYNKLETNSTLFNIDYDSRDNALLTKNGTLIKLDIENSTHSHNKFQIINFDFDIYKTILKNTIRFNTIYRSVENGAPIHNYIYQGKIDRTVGYLPFSLNSNKLHMAGVEWIYHYKEMHYKIFYNQIFDLENQQENSYIHENQSCYGLGVTFTSPFGPIELIWGYGPVKHLTNDKKHTVFSIDVGYKF